MPMSSCHKTAIEIVREARKKRGLSQEDVAGLLSKQQPWLAKLESGTRAMRIEEFFALAAILKVDLARAARALAKATSAELPRQR